MRIFISHPRTVVRLSLAVLALTVAPGVVQATPPELIVEQSTWVYEASGTDLGVVWRDAGFDDAGWMTGTGILGYGETYINTTVPYGPNPSDKYRTTYFRHTFTLGFDPGTITQLQLFANYDDGCVVYLNGVEVARASMPSGTISYSTFASSHESGAYELIDITDHLAELIMGVNVLAVEVHQTTPSSSDLAWDARLIADTSQVQFLWSGAATDASFRVKSKLLTEGLVARLMVDTDSLFGSALYSLPDTALIADNNRVVDLSVSGLAASTSYYYAIELNGAPNTGIVGHVRTYPPALGGSFTIAFGSCAQTGSSHSVFETIASHDPLLFIHTGDFHYENIGVADVDLFRSAYETVLSSPTQSALYRRTPVAYMWDDHDYGPNNSDSTAPGRAEARTTYQEYVPHYPLIAGTGDVPIYQAFAIGRVYVIMTDSRSARSPASAPDVVGKTMLGSDQKAWLKQELLNADAAYPLIVWINTLPWIGSTGDDGWHLYTTERSEIAEFIASNNIDGLCMLSGDAHMLAIDNGLNSDYSVGGGASFPVMHAAALDRSGSVKGGPYSEGAFPGGGQFGLMTMVDTGGAWIDVHWSGRNWLDEEIVRLSFSVPADGGPICECICHADPICDGLIDASDVVAAINVVFAGATQKPHALCPYAALDVNCSDAVTVVDIVQLIDIAFRGLPPSSLCQPCAVE